MPDLDPLLNNPHQIVDALRKLKPSSSLSLAFATEIAKTPGVGGILGVWIPPNVGEPLEIAFHTAPKTMMPASMFGK